MSGPVPPTPPTRPPSPGRAATIMLALAAALYVLAKTQEGAHWGWGYVRAFAEAGLVGGLADWFAVTALFRRPFGLPIPHTAVIPKSQGRIADALGAFIAENFLKPDLVQERVGKLDLAHGLGAWLSQPANARRLADGAASAAPALLDMADDTRLTGFLRPLVTEQIRQIRFAPIAGGVLAAVAEQGSHHGVIDRALEEAAHALDAHEALIREKVAENTGWLWRIAGVDARASTALIKALHASLREIAENQDHPVRGRVAALIARFADDLSHSAPLQAQVERLKADLMAHPSVAELLANLGADAKRAMRAAAADPEGGLRASLTEGIAGLGAALLADAAVREALNERLRALVVGLSARVGPDVARLVSETIRGWNARTVVDKLEQQVGRDVQYIRISGTLIGGLVGLALHAIGVAIAAF